MGDKCSPDNTRPPRDIKLPPRFRQSSDNRDSATAAAAAAAARVRRKQAQPSSTRGKQGGDVSRRGMTPQQRQQHQQKKGANEANNSSSSSSSSRSPALSGWGHDELIPEERGLAIERDAEAQRLLLSEVVSTTRTPAAAAAAATATAATAAGSPRLPSKITTVRVDKAQGRDYVQWQMLLLQRVCVRRGIRGMSACKEKEKMARLLAEQDNGKGRPSPYWGDLEDIAQGRSKHAANGASDEELSESDRACDTLLPERVKIEYSGAPGDSWAPARGAGGKLSGSPPQRRVLSVKRQKRELSATTAKGRQEIARVKGVKQGERGEVTEEEERRMSQALSRILSRVIDRIAPPAEETTEWRERAWEAEVGCARLAVSVRVHKAHKKFSAELEELVRERTERGGVGGKAGGGGMGGKAGGGGVRGKARRSGVGGGVEGGGSGSTGLREKYLENVLGKLEARMLEDTEAEV